MNQSQIENLSTEEYSYFLAYGSLPKVAHIPTVLELVDSFLYETCDSDDERTAPQSVEDVCSLERYDGFGRVLQDLTCTYT